MGKNVFYGIWKDAVAAKKHFTISHGGIRM
jgi:hypothetical protein